MLELLTSWPKFMKSTGSPKVSGGEKSVITMFNMS